MKQRVKVPGYWQTFSCIASKCEETCCAGWYIAIDEAAYKKYKKVKDPIMKKRLEKDIVEKKGGTQECRAKIKLKNNRCAFLGKDDLCDIYRCLGENYLSQTCEIYPRNINLVGNTKELSLALSCPEAARVVLLQKEGMTFREEESDKVWPVVGGTLAIKEGKPKHFEDALLQMREKLIGLITNHELSFMERMERLKENFLQLDHFKRQQDIKGLLHFLEQPAKTKSVQEVKIDELQQQRLYEALIILHEKKKWPSARYENCYHQMVQGLSSSKEGQPPCWSTEKYRQGAQFFRENLLKEKSYIFENYFVHYIYERLVPLDKETPLESFKALIFYFELMHLHLIGMWLNQATLDDEQILTYIQSFTRVFDHNEQCKEQLKKTLIKMK